MSAFASETVKTKVIETVVENKMDDIGELFASELSKISTSSDFMIQERNTDVMEEEKIIKTFKNDVEERESTDYLEQSQMIVENFQYLIMDNDARLRVVNTILDTAEMSPELKELYESLSKTHLKIQNIINGRSLYGITEIFNMKSGHTDKYFKAISSDLFVKYGVDYKSFKSLENELDLFKAKLAHMEDVNKEMADNMNAYADAFDSEILRARKEYSDIQDEYDSLKEDYEILFKEHQDLNAKFADLKNENYEDLGYLNELTEYCDEKNKQFLSLEFQYNSVIEVNQRLTTDLAMAFKTYGMPIKGNYDKSDVDNIMKELKELKDKVTTSNKEVEKKSDKRKIINEEKVEMPKDEIEDDVLSLNSSTSSKKSKTSKNWCEYDMEINLDDSKKKDKDVSYASVVGNDYDVSNDLPAPISESEFTVKTRKPKPVSKYQRNTDPIKYKSIDDIGERHYVRLGSKNRLLEAYENKIMSRFQFNYERHVFVPVVDKTLEGVMLVYYCNPQDETYSKFLFNGQFYIGSDGYCYRFHNRNGFVRATDKGSDGIIYFHIWNYAIEGTYDENKINNCIFSDPIDSKEHKMYDHDKLGNSIRLKMQSRNDY